MMSRHLNKILLILFLISCSAVNLFASEVDDLMNKANDLYKQKSFEEAIQNYEEILHKGYESPALYYNLGNAYYKVNKIGYAILNYEKALKLDPGDDDIQYNLAIANAHTVDKIKEVPQLFILEWWNSLVAMLSISGWVIITLVLYLLLLSLIAVYFFTKDAKIQRFSFLFGFGNLAVLVIAVVFLVARVNKESTSNYGVLIDSSASAKASPDNGSSDAFLIHEGIKFSIEDNVGDWAKIRLTDGKVGWLPKDTFGKI